MLRTAVILCLAAMYHATAAPYTAVASTDDHNSGESPKIMLSLGEEAEEPDIDDGAFELGEATPEEESDIDDLAFVNRDVRNKNGFLRFGRSASRPARTTFNKEGDSIRFNRGGEPDDNFIRLGRSTSFVRLGRGSSDTSVKTPTIRSSNSNFIRLGRGKGDNNFIRLGRGKNDFIRLGRAGNEEEVEDVSENNDSLTRLSRGGNSDRSFIRLGKGGYPSSSFVRLGRRDNFLRFGKADNFLRFGRGGSGSNFIRLGKKADNFLRFGKAGTGSSFIRLGKKADNFLRFGKGVSGGSGSNFIRLGKKADSFIRLGRGASNGARFGEGRDGDGARFGRGKLADRNFIRLGRSDPDAPRDGENSLDNVKPDAENTWRQFVRHAPRTIRLGKREPGVRAVDNKFMRFGRDQENVDDNEPHGNSNRSKRSTGSSEGAATPEDEYDSEDSTSMEDASFRYYYPLSARIPNYVFAPEMSVLPPLYSKRGPGGTGNANFIRLG